MNKFITILSAAAFCIGLATPSITALADNPSVSSNTKSRSITVSYSDVNLSHPAGIETLYSRLRNAASMACGPKEHPRDILKRRDWRQCVASALDSAVEEIAVPELQKLHLAATGGRPVETNRTLASSK